jgi:hypothetical protein
MDGRYEESQQTSERVVTRESDWSGSRHRTGRASARDSRGFDNTT